MGKNLGRGQFSRPEGKIAYKLKKAQNDEPYLRLPSGIHSDGHAALARNAQTEVNQACPPPFAVGELLRKAVRRGHMARQRLDELPKLEKEKKEDVAKLMAVTNSAPCDKKCCKLSRRGWSASRSLHKKINESEAELVASQCCSQSAAEPLVLSIPGLSIRPRQRRV